MNLSQQMTLLGLVALVYYAILLASGVVSSDVMPQFVASAVLFMSSGRLLRKASFGRSREKDTVDDEKPRKEPNWALRTQILNWVMATLIITALGLWVMKPVGVSWLEMLPFK
ncbi:MAG: hypothetical protein JXQ81_12350 [Desulfuromonadales bacterium]|nr:hypothetical protein [Desulfuromonadales bacterium]MBN2793291.1 hypothetical protein [Desulfuromonadales bacterium]